MTTRQTPSLLTTLLLILAAQAYEASDAPTDSAEGLVLHCSRMTFFTPNQRQLCLVYPNFVPHVREGVSGALHECKHQFRHHRWNCSTIGLEDVFLEKGILKTKSRESAYIHALASAATAYRVTKACASGVLEKCSCDQGVTGEVHKRSTQWRWGGCSHDVKYGYTFSREFMDPTEMRDHGDRLSMLTTLHNNEAGRRALMDNMARTCKCHGVSGSCTTRICWKTMPQFRTVGSVIREKYVDAIEVKMNQKRKRLRLVKRKRRKGLKSSDLVFTEKSPDFCRPNARLNIAGTMNRSCNRTITEPNNCGHMCCDRGYSTRLVVTREKCNCKFVWCCAVRCDRCKKQFLEHKCK